MPRSSKSTAKTDRDVNVNGDMAAQRDIIFGNQTNITQVLQMGAYSPPPNLRQLRVDYLEHLRRSYRALDFKGIPQLRTLPGELLLEDVYVPLLARPELPAGETWERRLAGRAFKPETLPDEAVALLEKTESAAPVHIEAALAQKQQVVVLGDPGAGKSTLLKFLALRLAAEADGPLPILIPLNAYAHVRADINLQAFLAEYFASRAQGVAALGPLFQSALAQGKAVVLLDGLDEVPQERAYIATKVEAFAREAASQGNKLVVTSRVVGYRDAPLTPKDWTLYTLLDFDRKAIEAFVTRWCPAIERSFRGAGPGTAPEADSEAAEEKSQLLAAIDANPGVATLASNPLLLTILALLKRQGVELPKSRVKLYDRYLETLIEGWNKARSLDKRSGGETLDYNATLNVLGPLALWLREENPDIGLVAERRLLSWLAEYYRGEAWGFKPGPAALQADDFLHKVCRRTNLLVERGEGHYGFIHLTFEEALAAYGLVSLGQLDRNRSLAYIQKHLADPAWRETILLAVGVWGILHREPLVAGEVVRAILKMECAEENKGQNILLAGACLEDVGVEGLGRVAAQEVQAALLAACRNRSLPPTVQRDAGFSLGRSGWVPDDLDSFITIPAGPFLYGKDKQERIIERPFAIAKYPVTNLQYRRFMDADGYNLQEFWSEEGWDWRIGTYKNEQKQELKLHFRDLRSSEDRNKPAWWYAPKLNNPLAPVVGVTWFEAKAYCNWLSRKSRKLIRLPSNEEWERAARHTDGRNYPWGQEFSHMNLNSIEFWGEQDDFGKNALAIRVDFEILASTTIVGQFPKGQSDEGLIDMGGNVWEWIDSWDGLSQIYRSLRGGAWHTDHNFTSCAFHGGAASDDFGNNIGFRVVMELE